MKLKYLILAGFLFVFVSNNFSAEEQCSMYYLIVNPFFNTTKSIQNENQLTYPDIEQRDSLMLERVFVENRGDCIIPLGNVILTIFDPDNREEHLSFYLKEDLPVNESRPINISKEDLVQFRDISLDREGTWEVDDCEIQSLEIRNEGYYCYVHPFGEHGERAKTFNVMSKGTIMLYEKIKELVETTKSSSNWNIILAVVMVILSALMLHEAKSQTKKLTESTERQIRHRERLDILQRKRIIRGLIEETKKNIETCKTWMGKKEIYLSDKNKKVPFDRFRVDSMRRVLVEHIIENEDLESTIRYCENRFTIINNFLDRLMLSGVPLAIKVETLGKVFDNISDLGGVKNLENLVEELEDNEKTLKPPEE